jgi:hypothetical protein
VSGRERHTLSAFTTLDGSPKNIKTVATSSSPEVGKKTNKTANQEFMFRFVFWLDFSWKDSVVK